MIPPPGWVAPGEGERVAVGEGEGDLVPVGEGEGDLVPVGDGEGDLVGEGEGEAPVQSVATLIVPSEASLSIRSFLNNS